MTLPLSMTAMMADNSLSISTKNKEPMNGSTSQKASIISKKEQNG